MRKIGCALAFLITLVFGVIFVILSMSVAIKPEIDSKTIPVVTEKEQKEKFDIIMKLEDYSIEEKNSENVLIIYISGNIPSFFIEKKSADKINEFYKEDREELKSIMKEELSNAKNDYKFRKEENLDINSWAAYGIGRKYSSERMDKAVISVVQEDYRYFGGVYPSTSYSAQNFDTRTQELLTLEDITTDREKAIEFINEYILNLTKKAEDQNYFYEDYEKNISNILTDETWYFSDEGFVVICNEYMIAPRAVGVLKFTIPYDEFIYLKEEYKLSKSSEVK